MCNQCLTERKPIFYPIRDNVFLAITKKKTKAEKLKKKFANRDELKTRLKFG